MIQIKNKKWGIIMGLLTKQQEQELRGYIGENKNILVVGTTAVWKEKEYLLNWLIEEASKDEWVTMVSEFEKNTEVSKEDLVVVNFLENSFLGELVKNENVSGITFDGEKLQYKTDDGIELYENKTTIEDIENLIYNLSAIVGNSFNDSSPVLNINTPTMRITAMRHWSEGRKTYTFVVGKVNMGKLKWGHLSDATKRDKMLEALRKKRKWLVLDEVRTSEDLSILCEANKEGVACISTLHGANPINTWVRLYTFGRMTEGSDRKELEYYRKQFPVVIGLDKLSTLTGKQVNISVHTE